MGEHAWPRPTGEHGKGDNKLTDMVTRIPLRDINSDFGERDPLG
jgi:hypothetical protein